MTSENCVLSLRNKKSHDARFYKILAALSCDDVEWKFFRETLKFLCVPELEDIVEERNCKNKCGYVLCNKTIKIHPTAIYTVHKSKGQIYNISNRKKYCSDWCYGAYKYISDQILSEPLWRNKNQSNDKEFTLYSKSEVGCAGEIYFDDEIITKNSIETIHNDKIANLTNEYKDTKQKTITQKQVIKKSSPEILKNKTNDCTELQQNLKQERIIQNVINSLDKLAVNKKKSLEEVVNKIKNKAVNNPERKLKFLDEYLNDKDLILIPSEEENLNHLQKVKSAITEWITEKTRDFICESSNCDLDQDSDSDSDTIQNENYEEYELNSFLPTLDSENQLKIRKNILIKKAKNSCVSILGDFKIDTNCFLREFEKFIYTCRLTAKNIIFTNKEFKWLMIVIIDLLSSKLGKVDKDKKNFILKKHGLRQWEMYETVIMEINNSIYQPINISISSQGDTTDTTEFK